MHGELIEWIDGGCVVVVDDRCLLGLEEATSLEDRSYGY